MSGTCWHPAIWPLQPKAFDALEAKLDGPTLEGLFDKLQPSALDFSMPKVKIEGATVNLKEELAALGMAHVFEESDFTGVTEAGPLVLADVFHKAFVKVNERGTEAAAATANVVRSVSAILPERKVAADRPYLFFVRDVPTKAILFTGRIMAPDLRGMSSPR